jgi:general secretion pathway protein D
MSIHQPLSSRRQLTIGSRVKRLLLALALTLFSLQTVVAEEKLSLNFTNTDIDAVITAVGKLTGKNFIIDPRVKGKVTVITNQPMNKEQVYQVFLSLLNVHGFAAIPGESAIKIVPDVNAKQESIKTVQHARFQDGDELITQVIPIQHINAGQLIPILRPLIPQRGHLAANAESNVLIISDTSSNVARLLEIIDRIDQEVDTEVEMIRLKHANATDVVNMIKQLLPGKQDALSYSLIPDERTNSVLLSGDKQERIRIRALISHMDIPLEEGVGDTHVIYLKYAKAEELVSVLMGVSKTFTQDKKLNVTGQGASLTSTTSGLVNIQADANNNALIINAPAGIVRSLRAVIQQLDIRRAQVLVEAVVAEVSHETSTELGVQWAFDGTDGGTKNGAIGFLNFSGFGSGILGLLDSPPQISDGLSLGLGSFTDGTMSLAALVRALGGEANTNILSTPSLVTMDNQEASIVVGQNVPFITGQYATTGGGANPLTPFQTIQREDVGLTLKIKPQINEGDTVMMDISQEISTLTSSTVGSDLITNKRAITTSVLVNDDQILVLGGLMEDTMREAEQKVPGLGDLPAVGWLFKYKQMKKAKTNLMVFIHPTILKEDLLAREYTGHKYNYIRNEQIALREKSGGLLSARDSALLPAYEPLPSLPPRYEPANRAPDLPPPGNL